MAASKKNTWVNYLAEMSKKKFPPDQLTIAGIDQFMNIHQQAFNVLNHTVPMIYLLDYTTGKYIYMSRQCQAVINFSTDNMLDAGIGFVLEKYHPADLRLFNEEIFPDRRSLLASIPAEQHKDYIFSYTYRVKNGKGQYVNLLQRNAFIKSDDNGNPLMSMGVITNINHFKEENPVVQLLEKVDSFTGNAALIQKDTYYLHEEDRIFSKREYEVLKYIAEGFTSKEIADKLYLSEHTIIQHKRSLQNKSGTQNAAALINFAYKNHLL